MPTRLFKEIGKKSPFESVAHEVLLNCMRTADRMTRTIANVLKSVDLTPTQYNVLRILRGESPQPLSCNEILTRMITRDADLTRLVDRLIQRGYVQRQRNEGDRRVVLVSITQAGIELLRTLDEPINAVHQFLLGHIPEDKLTQLSELLEQARERTQE
jgi:DNA-binding MarR family transcriptional regulator